MKVKWPPNQRTALCGTIYVAGRMVDVYEDMVGTLYVTDGSDSSPCKTTESELAGLLSWATILDWRKRKHVEIWF